MHFTRARALALRLPRADPSAAHVPAGRPERETVDQLAQRSSWRRHVWTIGLGTLFLALTVWSWRKWPDPLIDFGRELYVPWQLTTGKVLYRDIASLFGPLSPYVNALWFRLFDVSLTTLIACNLVILGLITAGIRHLMVRASDTFSGNVAAAVFLLLFGFSQHQIVGNYNFVAPYSHEATHGFALAIAAMVCLHVAVTHERRSLFALAGVCFGAILLTKPEVAVAAAALVGLTFAAPRRSNASGRAYLAPVGYFMGGATILPLSFFAYFSVHMSLAAAMLATAGAWVPLFVGQIAASHYYAAVSGLNEPAGNMLRMLGMFGAVSCFVAAGVAADRYLPGRLRSRRRSGTSARRLLQAIVLVVAFFFLPWHEIPRSLPLLCGAAVAGLSIRYVRSRRSGSIDPALLPLTMWSAFALVLLAKIALLSRLEHYGFYLAAPGAVLLVVLLLSQVPSVLARSGSAGGGRLFREIAALTIAGAVAAAVAHSSAVYGSKTVRVGAGGDSFLAFHASVTWQGPLAQEALRYIERHTSPAATVAVLPEGVMLNYLSRRRAPSRYVTFMPPEVHAFGEAEIRRPFVEGPPDFVVLIHKDMDEYGVPPFGRDAVYGRQIMDFVRERFRTMTVIGRNPMEPEGFGMEILARKTGDLADSASTLR